MQDLIRKSVKMITVDETFAGSMRPDTKPHRKQIKELLVNDMTTAINMLIKPDKPEDVLEDSFQENSNDDSSET